MSDTAAPAPAPAKKVVKAKKPKVAPVHPPVAAMVNAAIVALKDRKGSSLAAIKKYIDANNKNVDSVKLAPFIKRYLKSAVVAGKLVQTKGTGAAGSFKLGKVEKPTTVKTTPKKTVKKVKKPKAAKKTPKKVKSPKKAKKPKTPKKAAIKKTVVKKTPKKAVKKPAAKKPSAKPKTKKPAAKKAAAKK